MKICYNIFKKSTDSRFPHLRSLRKLALKTLAGFCLLASASAPVLAQTIPTITCDTDPAIFNTGIAVDSLGGYSASSGRLANGNPDAHWQYASENYSDSIRDTNPNTLTLNWYSPTAGQHYSGWPTPASGNARWIGVPTSVGNNEIFWYRYEFYLDPSVDPAAFNPSFKLNGDDEIYHAYVNDVDNLSLATGTRLNIGEGSWSGHPVFISLNKGWKSGLNRIFIVTRDIDIAGGLLIQSSGTPLCAGKLSVAKTTTQKAHVSPGQTGMPFDILVANNSKIDLSGAILHDPLPAGLASGSWTCSNNGTVATCPAASGSLPINNLTLSNLPAGSSLRFRIQATMAAALSHQFVTNTATLTPPAGAPADVCKNADGGNSCTSSASVSTGGYLNISKTASAPDPLLPGGTVTYDITLTNTDTVAVKNVAVNDSLPAGLIGGKWTCTGAACPASSGNMPLIQSIPNLPAQASLVYTVTATANHPGRLINTATIDAGDGACWNGFTAIGTCTAKAAVVVLASAVPLFGPWGYGLTGLGVLVLAVMTMRRGRVAVN
ncbi:MAG: DUF11 domain-containing protein [Burkholderiaceae bacterium]|nr:DUF11 domain-containing protein [Burkholderiaceae bacterium]